MTFNWIEYYEISKDIVNLACNASEEAKCRSAINRAYYAAFHCALDKASTVLGYNPPDPDRKQEGSGGYLGAHTDIISFYKDCQIIYDKDIGNTLEKLHRLRKWCDYDIKELQYPSKLHAQSLHQTERIFNHLGIKI